jgi:hypothetical protein
MHPQPRVRFVVGVCTRVFTAEAPETSSIPHAMVLRLISRSPRGPGFLAPVIPEKLASQELNASVGASGPHDFAVRIQRVRLTRYQRPPHPAPNVRDDRDTPLLWRRDNGKRPQFPIFRKRNISAWRTDNPNQLESARKIRFYAQRISGPRGRTCGAYPTKNDVPDLPVGQISRGRTQQIARTRRPRDRSGEDDQPAQNSANVSAMVITMIKWMKVTSLAASGHFLFFDWFGNQLDSKRSHDLSHGIEFGPRCFFERLVEALSRESRCL